MFLKKEREREKIHKMCPVEDEHFRTHHSVGVAVGYVFITAGENCQCQWPFHLKIETIRDLTDVKILTGSSELLLNIPSSPR